MTVAQAKAVMDADGSNETDEIAELAAAALDDSDGNIAEAADALADRVVQMPTLVQQHLREWARMWAYQKIAHVLSHRRRSTLRALYSPSQGAGFRQALETTVESEYKRLMDMPLFGGKRLGDATAEDLRESAARYDTSAKDMGRKAKWQAAIADALERKSNNPEATVGQTLTEMTVVRIVEEVGHE